MQIVHYPHPTLRHKSRAIRRVDADLRKIIQQMFELMYEHKGVGLAANQVDLPLRLFVANTKGDPKEGEELVFINPVTSQPKGSEEAEEGCLSIPGLYGEVIRPQQIHVNAYNLAGEEISAKVDGLLGRVIQHELDHLNGILFTDRLSDSAKADLRDRLEDFEVDFRSRRETGEIPSDEAILSRLKEYEARYC